MKGKHRKALAPSAEFDEIFCRRRSVLVPQSAADQSQGLQLFCILPAALGVSATVSGRLVARTAAILHFAGGARC